MSKKAANINKLFCVLLIAVITSIAVGQESELNLQSQITQAIGDLIARGAAEGDLVFREGKYRGEIRFSAPGIADSAGSTGGFIVFSGDSLSSSIRISCYNEVVYLNFSSILNSDGLSGRGNLTGICVDGIFDISGADNGRNGYDLTVDLSIDNLDLKGSLNRLSEVYRIVTGKLEETSALLGFDKFTLRVSSDSGVRYRSNEMDCTVSVRDGIVSREYSNLALEIDEGSFWKYGRKFKIISGRCNLGTGELSVKGESSAGAYFATEDSGSVRKNVLITTQYSGIIGDSIRCSMSSEPVLETDQIVNLLIRGNIEKVDMLKFAGSNIEDRVKLAVKDYRSDKYTRFTERQVGKLVSFDRVVIEGSVFASGSAFRASKELYRGVELNIRGTVGSGTNQIVSFEYPLSKKLYLINETNQFGNTGLDVRYLVKFK